MCSPDFYRDFFIVPGRKINMMLLLTFIPARTNVTVRPVQDNAGFQSLLINTKIKQKAIEIPDKFFVASFL